MLMQSSHSVNFSGYKTRSFPSQILLYPNLRLLESDLKRSETAQNLSQNEPQCKS